MKTLLTTLALLPSLALAANIKLADEVYVHQVDDQEVANYLWKKTEQLQLAPGQHRLKASFKTLVEEGFEDHETVRSNEIWVELSIPAEGEYLLTTPGLADAEAIKAFAKAPRFVLERQGKALATAKPSQAPAPRTEPVQQLGNPSPQAEQMLKYWWQQADEKSRANFKAWLKQQG
ncbi:DUF2057 family protein [Gallaecimonas sp. GXIMD4217]|uniref:DUF2057 family protein n=1 Tax=Gallaecimonas sp. GXIMD4217 TaxID=3131927 RepID=UPI00311AC00E